MTPAKQAVKLAADPRLAARDWDSYKAEPIPLRTFWHALGFALALPDDCQSGCHVAPESSGELLFEWYTPDPDRWLSLSIDEEGAADWCSQADGDFLAGEFAFTGAIPDDLIEAIRSLK